MQISIFLSFYHIIMPFFNMQRSFRVCVHARVAMHAYESGRKCIHVRNKTFFEGMMLVENEPPCGESWLRACHCNITLIVSSLCAVNTIIAVLGISSVMDPSVKTVAECEITQTLEQDCLKSRVTHDLFVNSSIN